MTGRLFTPLTIGRTELSNRICVPPMSQRHAVRGLVQPWHHDHYARIAESGAGLVVIEACAVEANGRFTDRCLGLWNEEQSEALAALLARLHRLAGDAKFFVQLSHAGRKAGRPLTPHAAAASPDDPILPVGASDEPYDADGPAVRTLGEEDAAGIVRAFGRAAGRLVRAGADGVQVHAGYGCLLHQFLSPLTNRRRDRWGSGLEERMRLPLACIEAIRREAPELDVMVRLPATDWIAGGWDEASAWEFAGRCREMGCCALDVTAGGLAPQEKPPAPRPGYLADYARRVREKCGLPVFTAGGITDALQAEAIVAAGRADGVCIGREILRNPRWGWEAAQILSGGAVLPPPYMPGF